MLVKLHRNDYSNIITEEHSNIHVLENNSDVSFIFNN